MPRDLGIADRLRAAGLDVIECDGWTSRGSSDFNPRGSVNHHTAGSASGTIPSLNTLINGRSDLPGPLCNVAQSREAGEGNDKAYVIAAGRANHAGSGGWQGLSGNSSVWGLEIEHTGTSELPQHRQETAARIHAAMFGGDTAMVCQHYEWTSRKIDAATNVSGNGFRQMVAEAGAGSLVPPTVATAALNLSLGGDLVAMTTSGGRIDLVIVGQGGGAFAYVADNVEGLTDAKATPLGGNLKAVSCGWSGGDLVVVGVGADDDQLYTCYWRNGAWSGWWHCPDTGLVGP